MHNKNAFHPDVHFHDTVIENLQKRRHLRVIVDKKQIILMTYWPMPPNVRCDMEIKV